MSPALHTVKDLPVFGHLKAFPHDFIGLHFGHKGLIIGNLG